MEVVAEATDGSGAVEAALREQPDVVVMDVSMPGMNGVEAVRRLNAEQPGTKVLCVSMHSDRRFVDAALRAGARGYLLKECAQEELVAAIQTVVADQMYVSPGLAETVSLGYATDEGGAASAASSGLTSREREVLQLLAEGHATRDIAVRMGVSAKTVGTHREHLMRKLGIHSLAGLTKFAIREGLTSAEE